LHRRIRELIEIGDRIAAGERLPAIGKAMAINSEFRLRTLSGQARGWTPSELTSALDALVELDTMVKGVPGEERDDAQRHLAFGLWVMDHAGGVRATTSGRA
jgi:DNA polymerase III delta subunit